MSKPSIIFLILLMTIGFISQSNADSKESNDGESLKERNRNMDKQIRQQEQEKQYRQNVKNISESERIREFRLKEGEVLPVKEVKEEVLPVKKEALPTKETKKEALPAKEVKEDVHTSAVKNDYKFDKIQLIGNKIYSYKDLKKAILNRFIGKPINKSNIESLQRMLSDYYIGAGYSVVKIYFDPKGMITIAANKDTGKPETTFTAIIEEGKIGKILLKANKKGNASDSDSKICNFRKKSQLFFAFPFRKNKPLKLKAFEQGLDQINRLQSNKATMELLPASAKSLDGANSDIIIKNNQNPDDDGVSTGSRTTFVNLNYSNSGQKATGENVINLNISQDNLLSINDNIYISYTEDSDSLFNKDRKDANISYGKTHKYKTLDFFNNDDGKKKFNKALYGSISFPLGYWTINASTNHSKYKNAIKAQHNTFCVTGKTLSQDYGIDRVMYMTRRYKLNLGCGLEIADSQSYVRDEKSRTASAKKSKASVYLNNVIYTKYGTFIVKPTYKQGLSWFGAKTDEETYEGNMTRSDASRQYKLANLFLYFNTKVNMPLLTIDKESNKHKRLPLVYTLEVNSQYSFNSLYGTDQISVGGEHTVRGYKDSNISADSGVYFRNDLKVNALDIAPDVLTKKEWANSKSAFLFGQSLNTMLSKTKICGFYDIGYVKDKYRKRENNDGYMMGLGVCLNYSGKYINSTLTYSRGLHSPKYLQDRNGLAKERGAIYWKIGASW